MALTFIASMNITWLKMQLPTNPSIALSIEFGQPNYNKIGNKCSYNIHNHIYLIQCSAFCNKLIDNLFISFKNEIQTYLCSGCLSDLQKQKLARFHLELNILVKRKTVKNRGKHSFILN